jgi:hypothetical protein
LEGGGSPALYSIVAFELFRVAMPGIRIATFALENA